MNFYLEKHTIFKTLTGSRVYGTSNEQSDYDYRGILIPPERYFFSYRVSFDQFESSQEDTTIYSLNKFLKLAANNNPNIMELLYIPSKYWVISSLYWEKLHANRDRFLSKKCFVTYKGYAQSQLHKIDKHDRTQSSRAELIEKVGYDCKSGMHLYRLLNSCKEILKEHTILVERPDKDFLLEIRNGNVSLRDLLSLVDALSIELESLFQSTTLPEKPDEDFIEKLGIEIIKEYLNVS